MRNNVGQNKGVLALAYSDRVLLDKARELCPVETHGVNWYPDSWLKAVGDLPGSARLTSSLTALSGEAESSRIPITRKSVVDRFADSALDGYLAAIVWGCGTGARNRARMLKVFHEPGDVLSRIDGLVDALTGATPGEAWDAMMTTHPLKWLGPAFGTKIAYFAALASPPSSGAWPLIADARVAAALDKPVTRKRAEYVDYCEKAWRLHTQLEGPRMRPDQLEYALFSLG